MENYRNKQCDKYITYHDVNDSIVNGLYISGYNINIDDKSFFLLSLYQARLQEREYFPHNSVKGFGFLLPVDLIVVREEIETKYILSLRLALQFAQFFRATSLDFWLECFALH